MARRRKRPPAPTLLQVQRLAAPRQPSRRMPLQYRRTASLARRPSWGSCDRSGPNAPERSARRRRGSRRR
eukprot:686473-Alexandrium_andersonii.AAC.1